MKRIGLILAVLASLAAPVTARGALPAYELDVTHQASPYLRAAERYWGIPTAPCEGDYHVVIGVAVPAVEGDALAFADMPGCWMFIRRGVWDTYGHELLCAIVTHEMGHSLGQDHNDDPKSVMDVTPSTPGGQQPDFSTGFPPQCEAFLEEATAPPRRHHSLKHKRARRAFHGRLPLLPRK
jgi:hypothetical protein